jgi:hypothetical protein
MKMVEPEKCMSPSQAEYNQASKKRNIQSKFSHILNIYVEIIKQAILTTITNMCFKDNKF